MSSYKEDFIRFMVESGVILFGDFVTKSGRKTPFFINTGAYRTGFQMTRLGSFYAAAIAEHLGDAVDVLFGPAYKGIPLVTATAMALYADHRRDVAFCFNRKEAKDHGEGGLLIGHQLRGGDRVLIVEDVVTAGTSVAETVPLLMKTAPVTLAGLVVSVDRQERGTGTKAALAEIRERYRMPAFAIVTMGEIVAYLHNREVNGVVWIDDAMYQRIGDYYAQYGEKGNAA